MIYLKPPWSPLSQILKNHTYGHHQSCLTMDNYPWTVCLGCVWRAGCCPCNFRLSFTENSMYFTSPPKNCIEQKIVEAASSPSTGQKKKFERGVALFHLTPATNFICDDLQDGHGTNQLEWVLFTELNPTGKEPNFEISSCIDWSTIVLSTQMQV